MANHRISSCGSNSHGQLGLSDTQDRHTFTATSALPHAVMKMDGGANHSAVLLENGDLYVCGSNAFGQIGGDGVQVDVWTRIAKDVKDVACGWSNTVLLYSDRIVQMGKSSFEFIVVGEKTSSGLQHLSLVDVDGNVWMWGNNKHGQLGLDVLDVHQPTMLSRDLYVPGLAVDEDVRQVACGQWHSLLVTTHGNVYATGYNKFGQLGLPGVKFTNKFTKINLPDKVQWVRCGWSHSFAKLDNGQLFGWGRCDHGQLAHLTCTGPGIAHISTPTLVLSNVQDVQCGSEHTLTLVDDHLCVFGWNEHGNCGVGHTLDVLRPTQPLKTNVRLIASGYGHSLIV
jgi:alpha-tubulin suppressor-like RCC1 family protein